MEHKLTVGELETLLLTIQPLIPLLPSAINVIAVLAGKTPEQLRSTEVAPLIEALGQIQR